MTSAAEAGVSTARPRARPVPAQHDQPFWAGLREHRLVLPHCPDCAAYWYPPAPRCPRCLGPAVSWRECPGRGTLWSWATARRAFAPGFSGCRTPWCRWNWTYSRDCCSTPPWPAGRPGDPPLRLGLPVTAVYLDDPRGFTVHAFTPAGDRP